VDAGATNLFSHNCPSIPRSPISASRSSPVQHPLPTSAAMHSSPRVASCRMTPSGCCGRGTTRSPSNLRGPKLPRLIHRPNPTSARHRHITIDVIAAFCARRWSPRRNFSCMSVFPCIQAQHSTLSGALLSSFKHLRVITISPSPLYSRFPVPTSICLWSPDNIVDAPL
jgi:hypothetical protein